MSAIGRNDPCPCGSGKKYKRCCLGKDASASGAWTAGERDSALAGLMRFARRAELDGDRAALAGRTPREAAGLKSARPKVIALLKDMENHSARERLEGRPAYDFGWMWSQLGLERSG